MIRMILGLALFTCFSTTLASGGQVKWEFEATFNALEPTSLFNGGPILSPNEIIRGSLAFEEVLDNVGNVLSVEQEGALLDITLGGVRFQSTDYKIDLHNDQFFVVDCAPGGTCPVLLDTLEIQANALESPDSAASAALNLAASWFDFRASWNSDPQAGGDGVWNSAQLSGNLAIWQDEDFISKQSHLYLADKSGKLRLFVLTIDSFQLVPEPTAFYLLTSLIPICILLRRRSE